MPRLIVVLGMHRSGTSAMTRALGYVGASLGENFIPTMPGVNEKGFWEDAALNEINIAVMRQLGVDWLTNRSIPDDQLTGVRLSPLVERAASILREKTKSVPVFAFKDPRTTLLLPFWRRVFELENLDVSYLIALRHPASVADSLHVRDGFDLAKGAALWLHHTVRSLIDSDGATRVLVDYDMLMDHPVSELRRIARALLFEQPTPDAEKEFADHFLSQNLRHCDHRTTPTLPDPRLPHNVLSLYAALLPVACGERGLDALETKTAIATADQFLIQIQPLLAYADQLEFAAASGGAHQVDQFPWLRTLRASFGIVAASPEGTGAANGANAVAQDHGNPSRTWLSTRVCRWCHFLANRK